MPRGGPKVSLSIPDTLDFVGWAEFREAHHHPGRGRGRAWRARIALDRRPRVIRARHPPAMSNLVGLAELGPPYLFVRGSRIQSHTRGPTLALTPPPDPP